jgi:hypothetical protein
VVGLVLAIIVILNLHIVFGPDTGYMTSPAEVVEHSLLLAAVDILLLIAGPALAVVLSLRLLRDGGAAG